MSARPMFCAVERMIALRYLRSRRSEGLISIIAVFSLVGIALGVATLIVVMAVMNGFRAEITNKILGLNGHISISSMERHISDFDELTTHVKQYDQVVSATPVINGQAMASSRYATLGVAVKAMRRLDINNRPMIAQNIKLGDLDAFEGKDAIIIGTRLASQLGVFVGDQVTLISPQGRATALGTLPRMKSYKVVALFESGMYEFDSSVVFMTLGAAQLFFRLADSVSALEVMTADAYATKMVSQILFNALDQRYVVQDWQMLNASLFNALKVERTVMFLILTLIVCVAAFNIVSSLIMLVNDKSKDIAILRTLGATRGMILRIFFMCGASVGVVGTLLGFILGLSFSLNIQTIREFIESITGGQLFDPVVYFLSELPAQVESEDVIWAVSMGLFFSFLATIYPAMKAAKQDPAEALRYE